MLKCRFSFNFQFWGGKQNSVPNMWWVVFAHISVEGRVIDCDVNGLFDGSSHAMSLPSYNLEVLQQCCVVSSMSCSYIGDGAFKCSFVSFFKGSGRLPNVLIITFSHATFVPIYDVTLFLDFIFIVWEHQLTLQCVPPLKFAWTPYLLQMDL